MKVKVVREITTKVEDILDLTPTQYCELRANMTPLKTSLLGNVSIIVKQFQPLDDEANEELDNFLQNRG